VTATGVTAAMASPRLVSVVVPCRDGGAWVRDAVTSALGQDGVDVEVIVVDDGSRDGSASLVRGLGDPRVTVLEQAPAGASRARTVGTTRSHGAYIQYLDADDLLLPDALSARVEALETSGADVAYSDWLRYERGRDEVFRDVELVARRLGTRPDLEFLKGTAWWPPGALLYRRSLVDRIGAWREDLPVIQDARFQLDAALLGARFVRVPGPGLRYRVHGPESLSRRDAVGFLRDCLRSAADLHARWEREGSLDVERRRALLEVYSQVARGAYALDQPLFRRAYDRLLALEPNYRPAGPQALRWAALVVGYPGAERLALAWRRLKRLLGGAPRALEQRS
jgi:glycosyltransferase involved in cell wall biosynthesis